MAEPGTSFETVPKLTSTNYTSWKRDVEILLQHYGCWGFVTGTEREPAADASDRVRESYDRRKTRAWTTIALTVDESVRPILDGVTSGSEAWKKLKNLFEPKSFARTAALLGEFDNLRFNEGEESIGIFLARIRRKTKELSDVEYVVPPNYEAYSALRYLPEEYDGLIRELYSLETKQFTLTTIEPRLIAEEGRLQQKRRDAESKCEYYTARKSNQKVFKQTALFDKKEGPRAKKGQSIKAKTEITCYRCNRKGHIARICKTKEVKQKEEPRVSNFYVTSLFASNNSQDSWIVDTGATDHFCNNRSLFTTFETLNKAVNVADNEATLDIKGIGRVELHIEDRLGHVTLGLQNTLYAPNIRRNLISGSKLDDAKHTIHCTGGKMKIYKQDNCFLFEATKHNGLFEINTSQTTSCNTVNSKTDITMWHRRLGHANFRCIEKMASEQVVKNFQISGTIPSSCEPCMLAKTTRTSFHNKMKTSKDICEKIHMDLWGKAENQGINGKWYFLSCIDDYSRRAFIYPIAQKSDTVRVFQDFQNYVEKQTGKKIKTIRTDNGLEFCNEQMTKLLRNQGIQHERTSVETPEENPVAERYNRTIAEGVRTILADTGLPKRLWSELVTTMNYVRNRTAHSSLQGRTPMEMWNGRMPSLAHLKTIGCLAFVLRPKQGRKKLDQKARKGYMVGYKYGMRGYRIWLPDTNQVISSVHVRFDETKLYKPITQSSESRSVKTAVESGLGTITDTEQDSSEDEHKSTSQSDSDKDERKNTEENTEVPVTTRNLRPRKEKQEPCTSGTQIPPISIQWIRKVVPRKKSERIDVFYYPESEPTKRLRSMNDVYNYCQRKNITFRQESFDFKTKSELGGADKPEDSESDSEYQDTMA